METLKHPLICFMGPSASGKTSLSEKVFGKKKKVITTTTREKRKKEKDLVDYYFISQTEFLTLKEQAAFFESDEYAGHYYGTLKEEVFHKTTETSAFAIVTVPGFYRLQEVVSPLIPVYITVSEKVFLTRLERRNVSETEKAKRKAIFAKEKQQLQQLKKANPELIIINNSGHFSYALQQLKQKLQPYLK